MLIVGAILGEGDIETKLVGLAEQVEGQVVAQNQVDQHSLVTDRMEGGQTNTNMKTNEISRWESLKRSCRRINADTPGRAHHVASRRCDEWPTRNCSK